MRSLPYTQYGWLQTSCAHYPTDHTAGHSPYALITLHTIVRAGHGHHALITLLTIRLDTHLMRSLPYIPYDWTLTSCAHYPTYHTAGHSPHALITLHTIRMDMDLMRSLPYIPYDWPQTSCAHYPTYHTAGHGPHALITPHNLFLFSVSFFLLFLTFDDCV